MIEQLKRLAELAPDVCEQVNRTIFKIRIKIDNHIYARNIYPTETTVVSAIEDEAWLVYALKRVIEARGWGIGTRSRNGNHSIAVITPTYDRDLLYRGDSNTEAAALLAALIEALGGGSDDEPRALC